MARRNVSIPDELDDRARAAGLNVSALTRRAILEELDRRRRMSRLDAWLDELDDLHGRPSAELMAEADAWARGAVDVADGTVPSTRSSRTSAGEGRRRPPTRSTGRAAS